MRTRILPVAVAVLAFAFVATTAQAQTTATAKVPDTSSAEPAAIWTFDEFAKQIKNPTDWFSWGGDFRVRNEYFNNALSLTADRALSPLFAPVHEQEYFRFRGRVWASFLPTDDLSLNIRLAAEPREFMKPATMDTFFESTGHAVALRDY